MRALLCLVLCFFSSVGLAQADIPPPAVQYYHTPIPHYRQRLEIGMRDLASRKFPPTPIALKREDVRVRWFPSLLQVTSRLRLHNPTNKEQTLHFGLTDSPNCPPLLALRVALDGERRPIRYRSLAPPPGSRLFKRALRWSGWLVRLRPKTTHTLDVRYVQSQTPRWSRAYVLRSFFPHGSFAKVGEVRFRLQLHGLPRKALHHIATRADKLEGNTFTWRWQGRYPELFILMGMTRAVISRPLGFGGSASTKPSTQPKAREPKLLLFGARTSHAMLSPRQAFAPPFVARKLSATERWIARVFRYWWLVRAYHRQNIARNKAGKAARFIFGKVDLSAIPAQEWARFFDGLWRAQKSDDDGVKQLARYLVGQIKAVSEKERVQVFANKAFFGQPASCLFLSARTKKKGRARARLHAVSFSRRSWGKKDVWGRAFGLAMLGSLGRAAKAQCERDRKRQPGTFPLVLLCVGLACFGLLTVLWRRRAARATRPEPTLGL